MASAFLFSGMMIAFNRVLCNRGLTDDKYIFIILNHITKDLDYTEEIIMAIADQIAKFVAETTFDDIPEETVSFVKHLSSKIYARRV